MEKRFSISVSLYFSIKHEYKSEMHFLSGFNTEVIWSIKSSNHQIHLALNTPVFGEYFQKISGKLRFKMSTKFHNILGSYLSLLKAPNIAFTLTISLQMFWKIHKISLTALLVRKPLDILFSCHVLKSISWQELEYSTEKVDKY